MNIPSISSVRSALAAALLVLATTGVVVPTAGIANDPSTPFDRAPWIADFDILRDAMTRNYANLEWARERGMDLAATEQRARMRLQSASNEYQARIALDRFIAAFGDGHLQLKWPDPVAAAASPETAGFCQRLGYRGDQDDGAVAAFLPDYEPLDPDHPLEAGIVTTNGTKVAVLRIDEFGPSSTECEAARAELRLPADKECHEGCGDAVRTKADSLFVTGMERRLRALATHQPDFLLIDLASNGGGNDSAIALARMLDAQIPTLAIGRMRGAALQGDLASSRDALRAALKGASKADAHDLRSVDAELKTRIVEAGKPCDRSGLWKNQHISCSGLVRGQFYAGGYTATPISANHAGGAVLSVIASYRFASGIWSRPVAVLVDSNTASAAELAPAMLQDRKRAVIVGSPTFGAGCGWMLEPQPITLPHSGGRIVMPDCSRFRSDGSNEVDGITPDIAVGFRRFDTREQRAERLKRALPSLIERLGVPRPPRTSEF